MTNGRGGAGARLLFHSSVERKFIYYVLAAAATVGPLAVIGFAWFAVWPESHRTAYILAVAATADSLVTWFVALILRWKDVTFDGRHVRIGSRVFKTTIPVEDIVAADAVRSGRDGFIRLTTKAGAYTVPCRNAEALVQLIQYRRPGETRISV